MSPPSRIKLPNEARMEVISTSLELHPFLAAEAAVMSTPCTTGLASRGRHEPSHLLPFPTTLNSHPYHQFPQVETKASKSIPKQSSDLYISPRNVPNILSRPNFFTKAKKEI